MSVKAPKSKKSEERSSLVNSVENSSRTREDLMSECREDFNSSRQLKVFCKPNAGPRDYIKRNKESIRKNKVEVDLNGLDIDNLLMSLEGTLEKSLNPLNEKKFKNELEYCKTFSNLHSSLNAKSITNSPNQRKTNRNNSLTTLKLEIEPVSLSELLCPKQSKGKKIIARAKESENSKSFREENRKNSRFSEKRPSSRTQTKSPIEKTVSSKSNQVLANKFLKEFSQAVADLSLKSEEFDLNSTINLLQQLEFIKNDPSSSSFEEETILVLKLWKFAKGEEKIQKKELLRTCMNVMNLPYENNLISQDEVLSIHKILFPLYQNKQSMRKRKSVKEEVVEEFSFMPTINVGSRYLASEKQKRFGSVGSQLRDEYLQWKNTRIEEKRKQSKREKEDSEIEECTFKPVFISRSFSKPNNAKQIKEERKENMNKYTKSKNALNANSGKSPEPTWKRSSKESVQKEIERLRKARESKLNLKGNVKKTCLDTMSPAKSSSGKGKAQISAKYLNLTTEKEDKIRVNSVIEVTNYGIFIEANKEKSENDSDIVQTEENNIKDLDLMVIEELHESAESIRPDSELNFHEKTIQKEEALESFIKEHSLPLEAAEKLRNIIKST